MNAIDLDEVFVNESTPCGQFVQVRYRPGLGPGIITRLEEEARARARSQRIEKVRQFGRASVGLAVFFAGLLTGFLAAALAAAW